MTCVSVAKNSVPVATTVAAGRDAATSRRMTSCKRLAMRANLFHSGRRESCRRREVIPIRCELGLDIGIARGTDRLPDAGLEIKLIGRGEIEDERTHHQTWQHNRD